MNRRPAGRKYNAPVMIGYVWICSCGIHRKTDRARHMHLLANPTHEMRWGKP